MNPHDAGFDFEAFFHAHYARIARAAAKIIGDPGKAEDLALEVFWKLWRTPQAQGAAAAGWVYRTAVRMALNELRSGQRRNHYEGLAEMTPPASNPEEAHAAQEERIRVRTVLAAIDQRSAELLMLRSSGLSYEEVASAMGLNPASVGTLISRAQHAFRKEYVKQNGEPKTGR